MPHEYIPIELLLDKSLPVAARFIYAVISVVPSTSVRELCKVIGLHRDAIRQHCETLRKAGWIGMEGDRHGYVVYPKLPAEVQRRMAHDLGERLKIVGFLGEAIMRAWLDLLLADDDFLDNFRPDFLRNPRTGEPLEYDRYHPKIRAAFEFNGSQHSRTTKKYSNPDKLDDQKTKDLVKRAISAEQGIRLVVVEAKDLTLQGMLAKLQGLPLRRFDPTGPYVRNLEKLSKRYIAKAEAEAEAEAVESRFAQSEER
ncbi:MAG: hypothetical protein WD024_03335 [Bacillota bacterium]